MHYVITGSSPGCLLSDRLVVPFGNYQKVHRINCIWFQFRTESTSHNIIIK